jgi:hypothetical protein
MADHLVIGTPCYGGNVTHRYTLSLLKLQTACVERGVKLSFRLLRGDALVTRARNLIAASFLAEPDATHLLYVDADIGFEPEQALALLESGKEVAAGIYPLKHLDRDRPGQLSYAVEFDDPAAIVPEGRFARARYAATGFLMLRRSVLERMAAHHPEIAFRASHTLFDGGTDPVGGGERTLHAFFDAGIDAASGLYLSEDYNFCRRWTAMGGEIWVDLDSRLTHIGPIDFPGDFRQALRPSGQG